MIERLNRSTEQDPYRGLEWISELRYGLGHVLAWPFLKDLEDIRAGQAMGQVFSIGYRTLDTWRSSHSAVKCASSAETVPSSLKQY